MSVSRNSPSKQPEEGSTNGSFPSTLQPSELNLSSDINFETILDEANQAFLQKKYEKASGKYSQVAEAYGQTYGAFHPKCADVMFRYGRALLNYAIEKSGVLGDDEQVRNATGKREKDLLTVFDDTVTAELASSHTSAHIHFDEGNEDDEASEDQEEEGEEEEESMEADDFEIAFEVLGVARVIYTSMLNGEIEKDISGIPFEGKGKEKLDVDLIIKQRLAEVISTLADVGLESESFSQAILDYQAALSMLSELVLPSDRSLAETHYKLALAMEYGGQSLEDALEHLKASRSVMLARKAALGPAGYAESAEIDELVPELDFKIEDVEQQIYLRDHPGPQPQVDEPDSKVNVGQSSNINDLSGLVKKKSHSSQPSSSSSLSSPHPSSSQHEETKRKRSFDQADEEERVQALNGKEGEQEHLKHARFK